MELKGTKTEKNLMEAFCRREHGPQQVHLLCKRRKEGRLRAAGRYLRRDRRQRERTRQAVVQGPLRRLHPRHPDLPRDGSQRRERRVDRYVPRMAAEAKEEGFTQLAALFTMVGQIEKGARGTLPRPAANLKEGKVFAREEQQVWVCRNCGYTHIGKSAPLKCPVCAHPQSYFELKAKNY